MDIKKTFGFNWKQEISDYGDHDLSEYIPLTDNEYSFDESTSKAILLGFEYNKKVLIQGYHGTGKSSHIEQIANRLNWPCVRVNLDGHVGRIDLIGKDAIVLEDGKQVTSFKPGILPWAMENGVALVLDEYDAGRPDVMFVLQRVLEQDGRLILTDQNRIITPHPKFRIFATANTLGLGDASGMYHGTNPINQGQLDRFNMVVQLNYLPEEEELVILTKKFPKLNKADALQMIRMANLTRNGFKQGHLSCVMSPRTVMNWADNINLFDDREQAFKLTFMNKCDDAEHAYLGECYQRCFDVELG